MAAPVFVPPPEGGGWQLVMTDFSDAPRPATTSIPEQRAAGDEGGAGRADDAVGGSGGSGVSGAGVPGPASGGRKSGRAPKGAAKGSGAARSGKPPRPGLLAGRRPSPLLLLAAGVLAGGAVSGLMLVMLAGWGLGYMSHRLSDLMRKFAVLGIPLGALGATTAWFWGRAEGRWGEPLQPGQQVGPEVWAAVPGVLRAAAVLSALFLLVVTMRRRGEAAAG
ncbi:hypothetical protein ACWGB8_06765 [Kitasatospora sp. NPDC054939]